ncbi:ROK family member transcriptional repressor [Pedobacter sp. BAL39]|uniref:class I mannose-6-phosphate isomerase n=1 Tax=Pedobacter sp. BAL39 TaxID=391596 RepID=UPI000155A3C0|nr:class I mannose-6-phosphate isomerase [Pedobacter sp. BAL39]EDM33999.1 ROK family member transcriptional repressor [Pedobacter sp. BAL39]
MTYEIDELNQEVTLKNDWRKTTQYLMPPKLKPIANANEEYQVYPTCSLGSGKIFNGFETLSKYIIGQGVVMIDGYAGIFWDRIREGLQQCFTDAGLSVNWIDTADFLKPTGLVDELVKPFLGTEDAVWGTRTTLTLRDLFEDSLGQQQTNQSDINIIIGTGAALSGWKAPLIYFDLPKNELQFRMRAGSICNLGAAEPQGATQMYKRFYFVDWVMLNNHKKEILNHIEVMADGQWMDTFNWCFKKDLLEGLDQMSRSVIRARPWFEPGAWGGQWIKKNIEQINKDVVNLAWSFELISPENGLVFESDGHLLEVSFDTLMFTSNENILGRHAARFGDEFPIRFDFLDTVDGGNLSIQCHPSLKYIQENFGETLTQDETYYILDCEDDAKVYLGFQEGIDPVEYRAALEESKTTGKEIAIEKYVQSFTAAKHDLFLIPNGTVHSAGAGNLVLEISATPYIFTFKMYDWVRLDLDGNPRPINIDHAFHNLDFNRKGESVADELISKTTIIEKTEDYQLVHLPTHKDHFYDVHRIEFEARAVQHTDQVCHVLMVVEGDGVLLETADGTTRTFAFAETFIVPAAAESYTLTNLGKAGVKVIKAFLK